MDREHTGHERNLDAAIGEAVAVAEEELVVEEHLGDRPVGPGGELPGEHVDVVLDRRRLRVALGVGRDGHVERAARLHGCDQISGALEAVWVGRVSGTDPFRRIAAQGDDVAHSECAVAVEHRLDVADRLTDAGEVTGDHGTGVGDGADGVERALPVGPAGAVGDRDEQWIGGVELIDRCEQVGQPVAGAGWEDLEAERRHRVRPSSECSGAGVTPLGALGWRACHRHTVRRSSSPPSGGSIVEVAPTSSPA